MVSSEGRSIGSGGKTMRRCLLTKAGLAFEDKERIARLLAELMTEQAGHQAEVHWSWNGPDRPPIVVVAPKRRFERRALASALAAGWRSVAPRGPEATFILLDDNDEHAKSLVARTMVSLKRPGADAGGRASAHARRFCGPGLVGPDGYSRFPVGVPALPGSPESGRPPSASVAPRLPRSPSWSMLRSGGSRWLRIIRLQEHRRPCW